jgi:hypothetical protein
MSESPTSKYPLGAKEIGHQECVRFVGGAKSGDHDAW